MAKKHTLDSNFFYNKKKFLLKIIHIFLVKDYMANVNKNK